MTSLTTAPASATGYHGRYLALGDSVAFGYRPAAVTPRTDYLDAANFRGYAEKYATLRGLRLANASCPGETTASMLTAGAQSNGCENSLGAPAGYRTAFPLHAAYAGTQVEYAVAYLVSQVRALDSVLSQIVRRYRGAVADGFTAFRLASLGSGGDPCAAGLLIALPGGGCDVHPSPAGHRVWLRRWLCSLSFGWVSGTASPWRGKSALHGVASRCWSPAPIPHASVALPWFPVFSGADSGFTFCSHRIE
ncbi:hypothetical protein [Amycolatopsis sp. MtRt-6]|uniref:SGNH/GDSL hydrolase family protein n=1 Tax=Amycolatopsis sp. MtRt-6 TaxID=2792782 RepID=UPI001A9062E0|nr:hypothetical protein [Amycolatopsis sp. MtRt-6]